MADRAETDGAGADTNGEGVQDLTAMVQMLLQQMVINLFIWPLISSARQVPEYERPNCL
jgi:hypothetical protein